MNRKILARTASHMALVLSVPFAAMPVLAERPMAVDDAGTLDQGGAKLEFGWSRDDRARGIDGAAGYAPIENLELELNFERLRDHATDPATRVSGTGFALKWVPLQQETGLSAGLKFEYGRGRSNDGTTVEKDRTRSLTGLASWRYESGQTIHANLGREWVHVVDGDTTAAGTWGLGFEQPLAENLQLTLETFGRDKDQSRPDKQLGLRWEVMDGLKFSIAGGNGNGRSMGNVGVAWEF